MDQTFPNVQGLSVTLDTTKIGHKTSLITEISVLMTSPNVFPMNETDAPELAERKIPVESSKGIVHL